VYCFPFLSSNMFEKSQDVEQDEQTTPGGGELPAYDDLAQQHGPNSRHVSPVELTHAHDQSCRFGRWKDWIEKRSVSGLYV